MPGVKAFPKIKPRKNQPLKDWIFRGATLRNLLKLFDWIVETPNEGSGIRLPEPKTPDIKIIY